MRLTIIVPDNMVGIDGVFYEIALDGMVPDHLHALQWYGDHGEEEYIEDGVPRNERIESLDAYQGVILKWQEVHAGRPEPEVDPEPTKEQWQAILWERIKAERDRRLFEGGILSDGRWFHSDTDSKLMYLRMEQQADAILAAGGSLDDPIMVDGIQQQWKLMDNSFCALTVGIIKQLGVDAEIQVARVFRAAEQHRLAMLESDAPQDYDFTGGWPLAYWEVGA